MNVIVIIVSRAQTFVPFVGEGLVSVTVKNNRILTDIATNQTTPMGSLTHDLAPLSCEQHPLHNNQSCVMTGLLL